MNDTRKLDYAPGMAGPPRVGAWDVVWYGAWWLLVAVVGATVLLVAALALYCRFIDASWLY